MMRTIWLASYPKSGNTWFRLLIANLSASAGAPADINAMPGRRAVASGREGFDHATLLESGLLRFDEIDRLRPRVHEALASAAPDDADEQPSEDVRFVKAHDAYTLSPCGEPLLGGARGAAGAILIVRDPRDVAPSLASHLNASLDHAIGMLNDPQAHLAGGPERQYDQLRQRLLSWSGHAQSWLQQADLPVHLVRYEDLHAVTAGVLARALAFAGHPATAAQISQAVALSDFDGLQAQERQHGFREAPPHEGKAFFRRGAVGAWRDELTAAQVARIEAEHADLMQRLGYPLSTAPDAAP